MVNTTSFNKPQKLIYNFNSIQNFTLNTFRKEQTAELTLSVSIHVQNTKLKLIYNIEIAFAKP